MELENQLIPYSASFLPEGPYLVFAIHPDDETIGMGGTIALASQKDISVTVVVITDGAESGETRVMQVEARAAADLLGVNELIFLGFSDRQVDSLNLAALDILNLINKTGARTIFLPSPLDYHPDHRAVTSYVGSFLQENRKAFSGEIWFYETMRQTEINRLIDITLTVEKKKKALNVYENRLREKAYDELCISINRIRAFTLPAEVEFAEGFWAVQDLSFGVLRSVIQSYSSYLRVSSEKRLVSIIVRTKDRPKRIGENHPLFHIDKVTARYYQWSRDNQINQKDTGFVESMKKKILDKHREKITADTILSLRKKKDRYWAELKQRENKHLQIMAMKEHEISNLQDRISSMNNAIQARDERIDQLGKETNKQILTINKLKESVSLMKSSVAWRMYESFAWNRERFLPPGTYRRQAYERIRHLYSPKGHVSRIPLPAPLNKHVIGRGLQVLKKQGPITFARYASEYLLNNGRLKSDINPNENAYDEWIQRHEVWDEEEVKAEVEGFKYKPKISVITPCFNVELHWLKRCIESVCRQFYDNWELCIYDDGSTENSLLEFLKDAMSLDTRIKIQFGKEN
ncbi:MAG: PIG-L family deacetylase, partial [Thermodesulfobacteriota bacterium]|nr:PIG-L family deacetylase [Thermodesulfobacteriota bacterium]